MQTQYKIYSIRLAQQSFFFSERYVLKIVAVLGQCCSFVRQYQHMATLILIVLWGVLNMSQAVAEEEQYGRYRAIVLHDGIASGNSGHLIPTVFIIDSKEGHMWTLDQNTKLYAPNSRFSLGTVLTYQGQVRPGKKMGEIVEQAATLQ